MIIAFEPFDSKVHSRQEFISQHPTLQNYIRHVAGQDSDRDLAKCIVATDKNRIVKGYYTLSNLSIPVDQWSAEFRKKSRLTYQTIPCTLIGRLAIDQPHQGMGLGSALLIDALHRSYLASRGIGSFAVVVDAIDDNAARFYKKYQFTPFNDSNRLFIPMRTIQKLTAG
jgi:GNAT superfamily N-acetyltransferase